MIKHLKPRSRGRVAYLRIKDYIIMLFKRKPKGIKGSPGARGCPVGEPGYPGVDGMLTIYNKKKLQENGNKTS